MKSFVIVSALLIIVILVLSCGGGNDNPSGPGTDTTPPTVVSTTPTANAANVLVSAAITATFSEEINPATISTSSFTLSGGIIGTTSYASKVATFTPSTPLATGAQYSATLTTAIQDTAGNALATNHTWLFTTATQGNETVTDYDGNVYHTVTIGTQVWMVENLKVSHYRDGTSIPYISNVYDWSVNHRDAYCYSGNTYRYTWYAVNTGKLAPAGWHVPTDIEWQILSDHLGGDSVAGGKMKESGYSHWPVPNTGATNESGFMALPTGYRQTDGTFRLLDSCTIFWSTNEQGQTDPDSMYAWNRRLAYSTAALQRSPYWWENYKRNGLVVRCVKD